MRPVEDAKREEEEEAVAAWKRGFTVGEGLGHGLEVKSGLVGAVK